MSERNYCAEARGAKRRYQSAIHDILEGYKHDLEAARIDAGEYKDEAARYAARRAELSKVARARIEKADRQLQAEVNKELSEFQEKIHEYAGKPANRSFMDSLRDVQDFDIQLSAAEVKALLTRSECNYLGLRALQTVARRSGYDINVPSVSEMEKQIERIKNSVKPPMLYAHEKDLTAALDCLGDQVQRNGSGDAVFSIGRPTAASIALTTFRLNSIEDVLTGLENAWKGKNVPTVDKYEAIEKDNGETISAEEQRQAAIDAAVNGISVDIDAGADAELAKVIAAQNAETVQKSKDVLRHYVRGGSEAR